MKIFDEIEDLEQGLVRHKKDYTEEYFNGYHSALSDLEERIKDSIEIEIK